MNSKQKVVRCRIYISSTDKFKHTLLSETLVFAAKRSGIAGATVFKGIMGFGSSTVVHSIKFWEIAEKLPVVVELVDERIVIDRFLDKINPWLDKITTGCLITTEEITAELVKKGRGSKLFGI